MLLGFTPLILAATAGHVGVVEILLDKGGDIEAQSERTKDTPLSLACSGGRQEVHTHLKGLLLADGGFFVQCWISSVLLFFWKVFHLFQCS